jgi:hypothetical protein
MLRGYKIQRVASYFLYQFTPLEEGNSVSQCRPKTMYIRPKEDEATWALNDTTVWSRGRDDECI